MEEALLFDKEMQTRMLHNKNLCLPQASSPLTLYAWVNAISGFMLFGMENCFKGST
jgi:hypothetical protein